MQEGVKLSLHKLPAAEAEPLMALERRLDMVTGLQPALAALQEVTADLERVLRASQRSEREMEEEVDALRRKLWGAELGPPQQAVGKRGGILGTASHKKGAKVFIQA